MTPRVAGRLAWTLWAVAVAVLVGALVLYALGGLAAPEDVFGFPGFGAVVGLAQATVGALVASRRPSNPIGWLFLGLALVSGGCSPWPACSAAGGGLQVWSASSTSGWCPPVPSSP